jgi:parallel beta-helix repeat protein
MAIVQNTYTGNGSTTLYSLSFLYLDEADVKVTLNGAPTTAFVFVNASTIQFLSAPANGTAIIIYRETDDEETKATFFAGSSIKAVDLNSNFTQFLYSIQELTARSISKLGDTLLGILNMGGFRITNMADPVSAQDAATKNYVDGVALSGTVPNGDRGDITVSGTGTIWTIDNNVVTSAKIADDTIVNADVNTSAGIAATKLSFTQAGTSAIARTIDSKLKDFVSVKDFGAVGNGVADDTAAINAAMASATAVHVYFPPGTYLHTGLTATGRTSIALFGDGATLFLKNASNTKCLYFTTCTNVSLRGLTIDGNQSNQIISGTRLNGAGVYVSGAAHTDITGNTIKNVSTGASILIDSVNPFAASPNGESCIIENNVIRNSGYAGAPFTCDAIYCQVDNATISGNKIITGTDYGVALEYSERSLVSGNSVSGCEVGLGGVGVKDCVYSDNRIIDCLYGGILFNTAGQGVVSPFISYRTIVSNNVVRNIGGSALPGDNHGILISYQDVHTDFTVNNNYVEGADYCFTVNTNGVLLEGNTAKNASIRGIIVESDSYVDVFDNRVDSNANPNLGVVKYGSVRDTSSSNIQHRTYRGQTASAGVTYRPCYIKTDNSSGNKACIANIYCTAIVTGVGPRSVYRQLSFRSVAGTLTINDVSTYSGDTTNLTIAAGQNGTGRAEILIGSSSAAVNANVYIELIAMDPVEPFYISDI